MVGATTTFFVCIGIKVGYLGVVTLENIKEFGSLISKWNLNKFCVDERTPIRSEDQRLKIKRGLSPLLACLGKIEGISKYGQKKGTIRSG